jgi:hypothetical protein
VEKVPTAFINEDPDLLERVEAATYALHRYADRFWATLGQPRELTGPLRLVLRAVQHRCYPREEWWSAMEKFLPPEPPDW